MARRRHLQIIAEHFKGPGAYFIRRPKIAALVGATLAIWGLLSAIAIPKESAPYIAFGVVNISTVYPGASAIDVDQLITQEIEEKIKGVSGINKYSSMSRDGVSNITLEFNPGQDMTKAMGDVRSKVDEAKASLPSEIENDPNITEIDSSLEAFLSIALSGDLPEEELTDYAHELKNALENVSNVAEVNISGAKEREIAVLVNQQKIDALGISLGQVQNAIRMAHADIPIGNFEINKYEYSLRFEGKLRTPEAVKNVVLINANRGENVPSIITIGDVAEVFERAEDTDVITRFASFHEGENRFQNAVQVAVSKRAETDILAVDTKVQNAALTFAEENFPEKVHMEFTRKSGDIMREDYRQVIISGLQSVTVVMLFIFFFVGIMEGLVASIVIPITFLITIGVLAFLGKTLNFMTNFSMILSLGILVDTAIVIVEGSHHFIRQGYKRRNAALLALHEYRGPLLTGTLTTLAVFIPLLSLSGVLGQYLSFIPVTVIIVLIASLFTSLILLPAYVSRLLPMSAEERKDLTHEKQLPPPKEKPIRKKIDAFIDGIIRKYKKKITVLLSKRMYRLVSVGVAMVLFFASFSLPIPFVLFPQGDQPFLNISVEMPEGTVTEHTATVVYQAEDVLRQYEEILFVETSINGKSGNLAVELFSEKVRKKQKLMNSLDLEKEIFEKLEPLEQKTGASIRAQTQQNGPPSEFPVGFRVVARDQNSIEIAKETAVQLTEVLRSIPKTVGVKNDIEEIPGEFQFRIDYQTATALGIDTNAIANTVRTALQGTTVASFSQNGRDVDIVVEMNGVHVENFEDILNIQMSTGNEKTVPLRDIVEFYRGDALAAIRRTDGDISFTVSSLLGEGGNAEEITQAFLEKIDSGEVGIPNGVEIINAGENEENAELMADLMRGFVIALLLMFLILVIQFNAFVQPLLILFTILFAQIGVAIGLWITDTPRSLAYILGAIALAGIVVNDAIIMIDQMNKNRRQKEKDAKTKDIPEKELVSAVIEAGSSRFIPVVLTTLTTSAGIIPLIFQDAFWAGLSYTIVFGLMVASFLTLFITPATYIQFQRETGLTFLFLCVALCVGLSVSAVLGGNITGALPFAVVGLLFWLWFSWAQKRKDRQKVLADSHSL